MKYMIFMWKCTKYVKFLCDLVPLKGADLDFSQRAVEATKKIFSVGDETFFLQDFLIFLIGNILHEIDKKNTCHGKNNTFGW